MVEILDQPHTVKLNALVHIRQSSLRSVNVERDITNRTIAQGYVLTAQALTSLSRILNGLDAISNTRSWTLTGPYGSGKSFFGLFISNLLGKDQPANSFTLNQLHEIDNLLANQVEQAAKLDTTRGLFPVPITGYQASIQECLKHGFSQALRNLQPSTAIEEILTKVESWSPNTKSREVILTVQQLLSVLSNTDYGYRGLLLVFDELGKPLEYIASSPENSDIYLLQEIAELANRNENVPFIFIGILHQAFDRYSILLDSATQQEWAKIQGRFEDIPFQEPPHQQIWLLANALKSNNNLIKEKTSLLGQIAEQAIASGWLPPMMETQEFIQLGIQAYPLHPTTLVTLPYLFRRISQNERSIFAYLASYEPYGFQEFVHQNYFPAIIRLPDLFDYISSNFQARLYASGRAKAIIETFERLANTANLDALQIDSLKTIGLLNWLGELSYLEATEDCILSALRSEKHTDQQILNALELLRTRSLIVYRRFNNTYVIWQGSDIDIEERLKLAQQKQSSIFSLAEEIQNLMPPRPLIARRHSYVSGTIRFFEVRHVDSRTINETDLKPSSGSSGIVFLCLPNNQSDYEDFVNWAQNDQLKRRFDLLIGVINQLGRLRELLSELRNLHWVEQNTPELRDDPVARKEIHSRQSSIELIIRNELDHSISLHHLADSDKCLWLYRGGEANVPNGQGISFLLSQVCNNLYPNSPILWNELINRRKLSSQASAARRNLIEAMIINHESERLGIEGYPPERSMYESMLDSSGLHRKTSNQKWAFFAPPEDDPSNIKPVWIAIHNFVFQSPPGPRSLTDLYDLLRQQPYGLLDGVLPVYLCAFLLANINEMTLYREGSLLPEPKIADYEVLIRRPELFSVAGFRVVGELGTVVERFSHGLNSEPTVISVVRALIKNLNVLSEYAWRTQQLPKEAIEVRQTIERAQSPEKLLFHDLPHSLGLEPFDRTNISQENTELFFNRLNAALQALADATPNLRVWARDVFMKACELPPGDLGWDTFLKSVDQLLNHELDPNLVPYLNRVNTAPDPETGWDNLIALIANRPLYSWSDLDRDRFVNQAQYIGRIFNTERKQLLSINRLNPEELDRSQKILADMRAHLLNLSEDPQVIQVALEYLLEEYAAEE